MTRAPWITHFGFTRTPFSKNIPAKDLLERASHQEAVARIRFCITESMLGVITGEVGVGKTVVVRAAVSQLDQAAHHIVYLANPTVGIRGFYITIVRALGAVPRGFKAELIAQAQDLLAAEEHERRRRVVLLVDEAHLLDPHQLEELRLLTSAEMDAQSPLASLLVGQPTLRAKLRSGSLQLMSPPELCGAGSTVTRVGRQ
jgi:type II secretory pathway predicted ATPase ExeA